MASRRLDISSLLCNDEPQVSPLEALVQAATEERKRIFEPTHDESHFQHPQQHPQHHHQQRREDYIAFDQRRTQEDIQAEYYKRHEQERRAQQQMHDQQLVQQQQQRRRREEEQMRAMEYERQREAHLEAQHRLDERQRRELEEREHEQRRRLQIQLQQHQLQQRERGQYRYPPSPVQPHPTSISHLITHSPPIRHANPPISSSLPAGLDRLDGDDRPIKKRRYSNSPTRHEDHIHILQQQERLARERERMRVGELGYGRVIEPSSQSPISSSPSLPTASSSGPRRPGSGTQARKVAVADLLVEREPPPLPPPNLGPPPGSEVRRLISPVSNNNRRSPPGSQVGRAKAARKSDEYIASLQHHTTLPREDPVKPSSEPSRPRKYSDEARTSGDDYSHRPPPPLAPPPRPRKTQGQTYPPTSTAAPVSHIHPPPTVHPSLLPSSSSGSSSSTSGPFAPRLQPSTSSSTSSAVNATASRSRQASGQAQEDPHEWFIHQYDEVPSPTAAVGPPPRSPSPSLSPATSTLVPTSIPPAITSSAVAVHAHNLGSIAGPSGAMPTGGLGTAPPHVPHSQAKSKVAIKSKSKTPPLVAPSHTHSKVYATTPSTTTPTAPAKDPLDKELEDLVAETKPPTPSLPSSSSLPANTSASVPASKPPKPPKQAKPKKSKQKQPKEETKDEMDLVVDMAVNELVDKMEEDEDGKHGHDHAQDPGVGMEVDVEDELLSLVDDRPPPPPPLSASSLHPPHSAASLAVPSSSSYRRLSGSAGPSTSHAPLTSAPPAQGVTSSGARQPTPIPPSQLQDRRAASEASQGHSSPIPSPIVDALGPLPSSLSASGSGKPNSTALSVGRSTSERESMPPPASTSALKVDRAGSVVAPELGSTSATPVVATASQTGGGRKKKETTARGPSAKAKAAAAKAEKEKEKAEKEGTAAPTKPKGKGGARTKKDKAAAAAAEALAASINASVASGSTPPPSKPKGGRKASATTASAAAAVPSSRSRSTSVMRGATPAADSEAGKVEEKEKEAEEPEPEEDNKLYCLCNTKYDESRFMIACDRCDEWYHTQCVNMPDLEVDLVDQFICPSCIEKNPHLNLSTTYKQRCLYGLEHPDPESPKACHKAARGVLSKYCSDECGTRNMEARIESYKKKGGKTDKLWETVKNAEKREGVVVCKVEEEEDKDKMDVDVDVKGDDTETNPFKHKSKHKVVPPTKTKTVRERERLDLVLASIVAKREDMQRGMEMVLCRERLLQLASERAEQVGQCGWDQRLCCDDEELAEMGASVEETYEENERKREKEKEEGQSGDAGDDGEQEGEGMNVDGTEDQWWCPGKKVCDRHSGWQTIRYKEVNKEKEIKEEALAKLTTRERDIRKRIEDLLDPHGAATNGKIGANGTGNPSGGAPLKSSNAKLVNGHSKSKAAAGEKKGKKRKAPTS